MDEQVALNDVSVMGMAPLHSLFCAKVVDDTIKAMINTNKQVNFLTIACD